MPRSPSRNAKPSRRDPREQVLQALREHDHEDVDAEYLVEVLLLLQSLVQQLAEVGARVVQRYPLDDEEHDVADQPHEPVGVRLQAEGREKIGSVLLLAVFLDELEASIIARVRRRRGMNQRSARISAFHSAFC